jgi:iron complex transport system ATP-binding protein
MSELSVHSLSVAYGRRSVLENITLEVGEGEIVGLIGANGSGKTTLLKAIAGLLPVTSGDILIQGRAAAMMEVRERAKYLSYLPQSGSVFWDITVEMLVSLGRLPHQKWRQALTSADQDAIHAAMRAADVLAFATRPISQLSGGERSRVLLARALASNPAILLADEPTSSLDPGHAIDVMKKLQGLAHSGMSLIVVMHDLTLAARHCDRLVLLHEKKIAADGPPADVLTAENLAAGFGVRAFRQMTEEGPVIVPIDRV